jgi:hypothetical protein
VSLDVYLTVPEASDAVTDEWAQRIYVRRDGQTVQITLAEWDEMYPGREPFMVTTPDSDGEVFSANITHNLGKMAAEAGLYEALWRPEEIDATKARDLIQVLRDGLAELVTDPGRFKELNPTNGWGDYDGLCRFTAGYLAACERWPDAAIGVSR